MTKLDRENLCVINLDILEHHLCINMVSIGDEKNTIVSMQSVFKTAILTNASNIIALHNHLAGSCRPTADDMEVKKQIIEVGRIMSIPVLDHVIVAAGTGNYYSMRENASEMFLEKTPQEKVCTERNS